MQLLVLNVGSSSVKMTTFEAGTDGSLAPRIKLQVLGIGAGRDCTISFSGADDSRQLRLPLSIAQPVEVLEPMLDWLTRQGCGLDRLGGVGHRIVHGGARFTEPVRVDAEVRHALGSLQNLAPLHMPAGLSVLDRVQSLRPQLIHIACFDTAFHASQPELAWRLPLPARFTEKGYRRYGFHGLSYQHVVAELPRITQRALPRRLIALHLGNGSSACAIAGGRGVATTMGYSPVDGLIMGTRTGSLDAGVMLALLRQEKLNADELETLIYRQSGLLALSGLSADMRSLIEADTEETRFAIDAYCHAAARHAGSLAVSLGGVDALVFTGGIGENAAIVRAKIASQLGFLGVSIDRRRNLRHAASLSAAKARVPAYIVKADEEAVIAGLVRRYFLAHQLND